MHHACLVVMHPPAPPPIDLLATTTASHGRSQSSIRALRLEEDLISLGLFFHIFNRQLLLWTHYA